MKLSVEFDIPDGIELGEIHDLYEKVISEARELFYKKNADYSNCWRLRSRQTITEEIIEKCVRVTKMLQLEAEGKKPQISEGVESEFRDIINWSIFGILISRGYGLSISEILGTVKKKEKSIIVQKKSAKNVPQVPFEKRMAKIDRQKIINQNEAFMDLEILKEELLSSPTPFPPVIKIKANRPVASISEFSTGPFIYINSDLLDDPDSIVEKEIDEVVWIRTNFADRTISKSKSIYQDPISINTEQEDCIKPIKLSSLDIFRDDRHRKKNLIPDNLDKKDAAKDQDREYNDK
jgi:hypothetical protein